MWDLTDGRLRREIGLASALAGIKALTFSSDGRLVLFYGHQHGLKAVDLATGDERVTVPPRFVLRADEESELNLAACSFAPGNRYLAICTGLATHVVEVASGTERFSCPGYAMAFTPDGEGLAIARERDPSGGAEGAETTTSGTVVEMAEIATGVRRQILIRSERVSALAFSPDARMLAVAGAWRERMIRVYWVEDGHQTEAFDCPATAMHPGALAFAPDCRSFAAGFDDTTALIWNVRKAR